MTQVLTLRPACEGDLEALLDLSAEAGAGMTTMPVDRETWIKKLELNRGSFERSLAKASNSVFVMVLENPLAKGVIGSCAVIASVGNEYPFYSYKLSTQVMVSRELKINTKTQILNLVNDFTGCTELASLFLSHDFRRSMEFRGAGRFLSKARFLLLHDFPDMFSERIFAELRGYLDENGESPFWNALGRKFFGLEYTRADLLSAISGNQFISDLMPKHPIYLDLLPGSAREVVGRVNRDTEPAKRLLEQEGFFYSDYIDIFDAGPSLECQRDRIRCIESAEVGAASEQGNPDGELLMVSNRRLPDYRVVLTRATPNKDGLALPRAALDGLEIQPGDLVTWSQFGVKS